jgi:penicillin amidase
MSKKEVLRTNRCDHVLNILQIIVVFLFSLFTVISYLYVIVTISYPTRYCGWYVWTSFVITSLAITVTVLCFLYFSVKHLRKSEQTSKSVKEKMGLPLYYVSCCWLYCCPTYYSFLRREQVIRKRKSLESFLFDFEEADNTMLIEKKGTPTIYSVFDTLKFIVLFGGFIICCCVIGFFFFIAFLSSQPKITGDWKLNNSKYLIGNKVHIYREQLNGATHIRGAHTHDVLFAQGYAHASDRIIQMEINRRRAKGTLAEVSGRKHLRSDKISRTLNLTQIATQMFTRLSHSYKEELKSYANGVNAYVEMNNRIVRYQLRSMGWPKLEEWKPTDSIMIMLMFSWEMSSNIKYELFRFQLLLSRTKPSDIEKLTPPYNDRFPTVMHHSDIPSHLHVNTTIPFYEIINADIKLMDDIQTEILIYFAKDISEKNNIGTFQIVADDDDDDDDDDEDSNLNLDMGESTDIASHWVVSGNLTDTGKPIMSSIGGSVFTFTPSTWYYNHLHVDKKMSRRKPLNGTTVDHDLNVSGITIPGIPMIISGQNQHISWSISKSFVDDTDLFIIEENGDGTAFKYNGNFHKYDTVVEQIKVRDSRTVRYEVKRCHYGPIMNDPFGVKIVNRRALALKWAQTFSSDTTPYRTFSDMARATSWTEFKAATSHGSYGNLNFLYADVNNTIGYTFAGLAPIRGKDHSGRYPVRGDGNTDWLGFIPQEELPSFINPERGYISVANQRIVPSQYKHSGNFSYDFVTGFRAGRIENELEILSSESITDMKSMKQLQLDQTSAIWKNFVPVFQTIEHTSNDTLTEEEKHWLNRLLKWNGDTSMNRNTSQEAILFETWHSLMSYKLISKTYQLPRWLLSGSLLLELTDNLDSDKLILCIQAFRRAVRSLKKQKWKETHEIQFKNELLPMNSRIRCMCDRSVPYTGGDTFSINNGSPNYRLLFDLYQTSNSQYMLTMGQSEHLFSDWYESWLIQWKSNLYDKMITSTSSIVSSSSLFTLYT